ncbi:hypothetical protein M885DRAFT_540108 [Pelagophyceae sp. CCMP2097]|nr:hypothetical protein M885DRAFT_540108 [Pelagophyceae sp. CCMP2097]
MRWLCLLVQCAALLLPRRHPARRGAVRRTRVRAFNDEAAVADVLRSVDANLAGLAFSELSAALHCLAKNARKAEFGTVAPRVLRLRGALEDRIGDADTRSLARAAWALAKLDERSGASATDDAVLRACAARVSEFTPGELGLVAWSCAKQQRGKKLGGAAQQLFTAVDAAARRTANALEPRDAATLAWAAAAARHASPRLFSTLARRLAALEGQWSAQDAASVAWAYATARAPEPRLYTAIARYAAVNASDLNSQGVANVAWAFATQRRRFGGVCASERARDDARCLTALAQAATVLADGGRLRAQALGLLLWAFSAITPVPKMDPRHPVPADVEAALFSALEGAVIVEAATFTSRDVASCASALARVMPAARGAADEASLADAARTGAVFRALAAAALRRPAREWAPQSISNALWAFSKAAERSGTEAPAVVYDHLARAATQRVVDLGPQDVSNVVWAYCSAGRRADVLFEVLARNTRSTVSRSSPQGLATIAWAYATFYAPGGDWRDGGGGGRRGDGDVLAESTPCLFFDDAVLPLFEVIADAAIPLITNGGFSARQLAVLARAASAAGPAFSSGARLLSAIGAAATKLPPAALSAQDLGDLAEALGRARRSVGDAALYVAWLADVATPRASALDARHRDAVARALQQTGSDRHGFFDAVSQLAEARAVADDSEPELHSTANSSRVQIVQVVRYAALFQDDYDYDEAPTLADLARATRPGPAN